MAKNVERVILSKIGKTIQETIESYGFSPIVNLSGHEMKQHDLHAGVTIPNIDDKKRCKKIWCYTLEIYETREFYKKHKYEEKFLKNFWNNENCYKYFKILLFK